MRHLSSNRYEAQIRRKRIAERILKDGCTIKTTAISEGISSTRCREILHDYCRLSNRILYHALQPTSVRHLWGGEQQILVDLPVPLKKLRDHAPEFLTGVSHQGEK